MVESGGHETRRVGDKRMMHDASLEIWTKNGVVLFLD
jgi:hypothetical protein